MFFYGLDASDYTQRRDGRSDFMDMLAGPLQTPALGKAYAEMFVGGRICASPACFVRQRILPGVGFEIAWRRLLVYWCADYRPHPWMSGCRKVVDNSLAR